MLDYQMDMRGEADGVHGGHEAPRSVGVLHIYAQSGRKCPNLNPAKDHCSRRTLQPPANNAYTSIIPYFAMPGSAHFGLASCHRTAQLPPPPQREAFGASRTSATLSAADVEDPGA